MSKGIKTTDNNIDKDEVEKELISPTGDPWNEEKNAALKNTHWCFTDYGRSGAQTDPSKCDFADYEEAFAQSKVKVLGLAWCLEIGKKNHKYHRQCYIQFEKRQKLTAIKKIVKSKNYRAFKMLGTIQQNETYCSKDGDLHILGEFTDKEQGKRKDLDEARDLILSGESTVEELAVDDPNFYHQYGRTLSYLEAIALRKRFRTEMTQGVWYHGKSGSGKSHAVFQDYDPATHYVKNLKDEWWDGYTGQEVVIFNEFRGGCMPFRDLLELVDKWPLTVKQRGKEPVPFLAKKLLISCCLHPKDAYAGVLGKESCEDREQFYRRFKVIELSGDRSG